MLVLTGVIQLTDSVASSRATGTVVTTMTVGHDFS
jgi:hypothetical protein